MDSFDIACSLLPPQLSRRLESFGKTGVEEIRLRRQRPMSLVVDGKESTLAGDRLTEKELLQVLERATGASLHSAASSMANGFISYKGLRIGVCGTAVLNHGQLTGFRNFSSLSLRLPREHRGICAPFIDELLRGGMENTLIISPPGLGKTTLLRELIRLISNRGIRVAVVDERNELSASDSGEPCFDLGRCSDVLTGLPKAQAAAMLLRGMNPQVIAMDEISSGTEGRVVQEIVGCGVGILASAHGRDRQDMLKRNMYKSFIESGLFTNFLTISRDEDKRRYRLEKLE